MWGYDENLLSFLRTSPFFLYDRPAQAWLVFGSSILAIATLIVSSIWRTSLPFVSRRTKGDRKPIPNGPIGLPVVGSFPFLTKYPELVLDSWAKKFGPLYSFRLGNQLFVVISDVHIAKDLLAINGTTFSSRKSFFIKSQTILAGRGITVSPYNDTWYEESSPNCVLIPKLPHRRMHAHILEYESRVLIKSLLEEGKAGTLPLNPQPHAGRASLNSMLSIVLGARTASLDDPLLHTALRLSREFMNCTGPVSNLVDFIPLLQKLNTSMKRRATQLHRDICDTWGAIIDDIETRLSHGEAVPDCLAKTLVLCQEEENLDRLDVIMLCAAFLIGGIESTAAIIQWFAALIPSYPEIQARAQAELDQVVGRGRLPTIEDEKNMPYIHALIKEVERCHNPFWLSTPHVNTQDFTYNGLLIPKDTVCILNTYTIHHDPSRYPDPMTFNPDRYIADQTSSAESSRLPNPEHRDHWIFGAGRRICPGMGFAEPELWLCISRMLWAFKMEAIPNEPIDLKEYDGLSGRSPVAFRIKMTPRLEVNHILKLADPA